MSRCESPKTILIQPEKNNAQPRKKLKATRGCINIAESYLGFQEPISLVKVKTIFKYSLDRIVSAVFLGNPAWRC